jgi:hypothetical protein
MTGSILDLLKATKSLDFIKLFSSSFLANLISIDLANSFISFIIYGFILSFNFYIALLNSFIVLNKNNISSLVAGFSVFNTFNYYYLYGYYYNYFLTVNISLIYCLLFSDADIDFLLFINKPLFESYY